MTATLDLVGMGDVHAAVGQGDFSCTGVGSGVVLAALDVKNKIGACAHFILPEAPNGYDHKRPGKYVNTGFGEVIRVMLSLGADPKYIRVALAGGSEPFSAGEHAALNLGARNLEAALHELSELGCICAAQDTGGQSGRTITLSIADGAVKVRASAQPEKVLCKLRG